MLLKCLFLFLSLLLKVINILKLIHIHWVHLEINHVELVLNHFLSLLLNILSSFKTSLDQLFDILVLDVRTNSKYFISTIVYHILEFIFLEPLVFWCKSTFLYNQIIKLKLHGLLLNHFFLHSILSDQSEDLNDLLLTNSVSSVHRLEIYLWVPITIIEYNNISCH